MKLCDSDNPLAIEIQQESATTYFAVCRRMVDSLECLGACNALLRSSAPTPEVRARRDELLAEAAERVFFVVIQREAMGLRCSEEFFQDYEVPPEVRARMGPRRATWP